MPTSSRCAEGSQASGYGYEVLKSAKQTVMIAGGAEELHAAHVAVFDIMFATSTANETPRLTPRPFDVRRDSLVLGERGGALFLESLAHALQRVAHIHAAIAGYGTNWTALPRTNPGRGGTRREAEPSPTQPR